MNNPLGSARYPRAKNREFKPAYRPTTSISTAQEAELEEFMKTSIENITPNHTHDLGILCTDYYTNSLDRKSVV